MREDSTTPLLGRSNAVDRRFVGHASAALAILALVGVSGMGARARASVPALGASSSALHVNATTYAMRESARRARASALGYFKQTSILPRGGHSPTLTYTLHIGCKHAEGGFFDDVQEARIVRHSYGGSKFFEWDDGIPMKKVNLFPGDTATFSVDTHKVDWEYGFAVMNSKGEVRYEIGKHRDSVPLSRNDECANTFGLYTNRIIGWDSRRTEEPGYIDYVFGSCSRNCIPTGDPHAWSPAEQSKNTKKMLANPPKGLGSAFKMYGVAGKAWCTINIHTTRGNSDDIMMVFNPRSKYGVCIMDDATGCKPAVNDPNGECHWTGDIQSVPWNDAEMGTVASTDMTKRWMFEFTYMSDGVKITLNDKPYATYKWRQADAGYDGVSYIQMNGGQPYMVLKTGECELVASAHPRVKKEHPEHLVVGH